MQDWEGATVYGNPPGAILDGCAEPVSVFGGGAGNTRAITAPTIRRVRMPGNPLYDRARTAAGEGSGYQAHFNEGAANHMLSGFGDSPRPHRRLR